MTEKGQQMETDKDKRNRIMTVPPPSKCAPWRTRGGRLAGAVKVVNERAVQDVPGRDPTPLLRTVPLPVNEKLVTTTTRTNIEEPADSVDRGALDADGGRDRTGWRVNYGLETGDVKYRMDTTKIRW